MNYTVSDFCRTFPHDLKIIAGLGGMARTITEPGILDYELDSMLKDKYLHSNFHENQLIVTTLSCVKDNPFLIAEAVRHLIAKGTSCLVIKNVFQLPIHESVLRYADSKNFPIILIESQDIYIEKIIYEVSRHSELLADIRFSQRILDQILSSSLQDSEIIEKLKQINPSCKNQFFTLYIQFEDYLENSTLDAYDRHFAESELNRPGNMLVLQSDSLFYTHSSEGIAKEYTDSSIQNILDILLQGDPYLHCGISQYHLILQEFKMSLQESIYAATVDNSKGSSFMKYGKIGVYQFLFPFAGNREMTRYAKDILEPIEYYDIENNGNLLETLSHLVQLDGDIIATAETLCQHRNTIRYRLDKIKELTGLDYKRFSQLEQLSMALKIRQCNGD